LPLTAAETGGRREGIALAPAVSCHQACKPGSVPRHAAMAIPLGRALRRASCNQPGRLIRKRDWQVSLPRRPYSVLLPVGFAMPFMLPRTRCALTAPFHPYPACKSKFASGAVCFLLHCPWGHPRRRLSGTVLPWSPDFPLRLVRNTAAERPSGLLTRVIRGFATLRSS
jgi:hypothetical protein